MKNSQHIRKGKYNKRHRSRSTVWLAALLVAAGWSANADQTQTTNAPPAQPPPAAKSAEKGAPLPLHQIEGNGGILPRCRPTLSIRRATASRLAVRASVLPTSTSVPIKTSRHLPSPNRRSSGSNSATAGITSVLGDLPLALRKPASSIITRTKCNCTTSTRASKF